MFPLATLLIVLCFVAGSPAWAQRVSGGAVRSGFATGSAQTGAFSQNFQQNPSGFLRSPHVGTQQPSQSFHSHGHGRQIIIENSTSLRSSPHSGFLHSTGRGNARREPRETHRVKPPTHGHFPKHQGVLIIEIPRTVIETRVNTQLVPASPGDSSSGIETEGLYTQYGAPRKSAKHVAPFDPTPREVVERMLELAGVKKDDVVYDLGSGDGRIVIAAAKKYGVKAVGFEIDPGLVKLSRENIRKEGLEDLVKIRQEDFTRADFSAATVVTLYLSFDGNLKVRPLLQRQLKPGTRVVSYHFDMGDWQPKIVEAYRDSAGEVHTLYLWLISGPFVFSENR